MVEHTAENRGVAGSIPALAIPSRDAVRSRRRSNVLRGSACGLLPNLERGWDHSSPLREEMARSRKPHARISALGIEAEGCPTRGPTGGPDSRRASEAVPPASTCSTRSKPAVSSRPRVSPPGHRSASRVPRRRKTTRLPAPSRGRARRRKGSCSTGRSGRTPRPRMAAWSHPPPGTAPGRSAPPEQLAGLSIIARDRSAPGPRARTGAPGASGDSRARAEVERARGDTQPVERRSDNLHGAGRGTLPGRRKRVELSAQRATEQTPEARVCDNGARGDPRVAAPQLHEPVVHRDRIRSSVPNGVENISAALPALMASAMFR